MPEDWRHRNLMDSSLCLGTLWVAVFWLIASRSNFDPPSSKSLIPKQFQGCLGHQQVPWGSLLSRVGASNLDLAELPDGADDGEDVVLVVVEPHHRAAHPRLGEGGAAALREEGEVSFIQNFLVIFVRERITNTCDVNLNPAYFSWEDPVDWLLETWPWPSHPRWEIWQWCFFYAMSISFIVYLSASNTFLLRTEEVTRVRPEDVGYDQARPLSLVGFHRWVVDDGGLMVFF